MLLGIPAAFVTATMVASVLARLGFPLPPDTRRIGCIDGLRGYLSIAVLAHHFILWLEAAKFGFVGWGSPIPFFNQLGLGAVALFFMTTGLLFYPRILAGWKHVSWPAVFLNRVFRILPLLILSVALVTLVVSLRTGRGLDQAYAYAALQWVSSFATPPLLGYSEAWRVNAGVLWSLHYEWIFYLAVIPISAALMDAIRGRAPSWVVPLALLLVSSICNVTGLSVSILRYMPAFAFGMLAYEIRMRPAWSTRLGSPMAGLVALVALLTGMAFWSTPFGVALPFFAVFFIAVACDNDLRGLLTSKGALVLGECSYGIYLMHGIALSILFQDGDALIASIPASVLPILLPLLAVMVVAVTAVTHLAIERPMIRAGKRLSTLLVRSRDRRRHAPATRRA